LYSGEYFLNRGEISPTKRKFPRRVREKISPTYPNALASPLYIGENSSKISISVPYGSK